MFNEFMEIVDLLLMYPTVIPFTGLVVAVGILLVSMVTIGFDSHMELPTEIAGFDNPLVTAGLSKVPLFIGLSLTFLPMTIFICSRLLPCKTVFKSFRTIRSGR